MSKELLLIFGIALALLLMQSIGGYFQIKDYKKAVRRMHKLGNVGFGQTRGGFFSGSLVLIACDRNGIITGAEVMEGMTFLTHFKPKESVLDWQLQGSSIDEILDKFSTLAEKKRKRYKGYTQAIEALRMRLKQEAESTSEQHA